LIQQTFYLQILEKEFSTFPQTGFYTACGCRWKKLRSESFPKDRIIFHKFST